MPWERWGSSIQWIGVICFCSKWHYDRSAVESKYSMFCPVLSFWGRFKARLFTMGSDWYLSLEIPDCRAWSLVWVSPVADHETTIWGQIIYLVGRRHTNREEEREPGKGGPPKLSKLSRQLLPWATGAWFHQCGACISASSYLKDQGAGVVIYHLLPCIHW